MGDREQANTKKREFRATPRRFHAARAAHSDRPRAQVCVVEARLCAAPGAPDDQQPGLTGFYQEETNGRPRYTMQINQAGDHLRVWVRQVLHNGYGKNEHESRRWRYFGRRIRGEQVFRLFLDAGRWDYFDGEISGSPGSLKFRGSGITGESLPELVFERCAGREALEPVYSDRVRELMEMDGSEDARSLMYQEYYRLPQYDLARIQRAAKGPELKRLLDAFLDQPTTELHDLNHWQQCILDLDNYVAQQLFQRKPRARGGSESGPGIPNGTPESWHEGDLDAVYKEIWFALRFEPHVRGNVGGSMLGWLAHAVQVREQKQRQISAQAEHFYALTRLLKLEASAVDRKPYRYEFQFLGLQGGFKWFLGVKCRFGAVRVSRNGADLGRFNFLIGVGSAGAAAGGGMGKVRETVVVESHEEWETKDFPGVLEFIEAGAGATVDGAGGSGKLGAIVVHGPGRHRPLVLDLSGVGVAHPISDPVKWAYDPKPPKLPELKGEIGVSASLGAGYLWGDGLQPLKYIRREVDVDPAEVGYVKQLTERQKVHFFEGDSLLTPWGRQVLGTFCAEELRALGSETCRLAIDGYADPEGSEESNRDLSEWRAQNIAQAVIEIVGETRLRAELGVPEGHGEGPALAEVADGAEAPQWRRVNVTLDRSVALTLHAPRA